MESISQSGRATLIAKMDIKSAYRMVLFTRKIDPSWPYDGLMRCFRLPSAPTFFTAVADVLLAMGSSLPGRLPYHGPAQLSGMCKKHGGYALSLQEVGCASGPREMCRTSGGNCVPGF